VTAHHIPSYSISDVGPPCGVRDVAVIPVWEIGHGTLQHLQVRPVLLVLAHVHRVTVRLQRHDVLLHCHLAGFVSPRSKWHSSSCLLYWQYSSCLQPPQCHSDNCARRRRRAQDAGPGRERRIAPVAGLEGQAGLVPTASGTPWKGPVMGQQRDPAAHQTAPAACPLRLTPRPWRAPELVVREPPRLQSAEPRPARQARTSVPDAGWAAQAPKAHLHPQAAV
jgi:hypothetical protein